MLYDDHTVEPAFGPLPRVIEKLERTVISNGGLDFAFFSDGVKLAIQNMTWNGLQGFQNKPPAQANLFVPYHPGLLEIFFATIFGDPREYPSCSPRTPARALLGLRRLREV